MFVTINQGGVGMSKVAKLIVAGFSGFMICLGFYQLGFTWEVVIVGSLVSCLVLFQIEANWKSLIALTATALICVPTVFLPPEGAWAYIMEGFLANLVVEAFEMGKYYSQEEKPKVNFWKITEATTAWIVSGASIHALICNTVPDLEHIGTGMVLFMMARETAWVAAARTMSMVAILGGTVVSIILGVTSTFIPHEYVFTAMVSCSLLLLAERTVLTIAHLIKKLYQLHLLKPT